MRVRLTYAIILFSGITLTTLIPAGRLYSQMSENRLEYRGLIPQSRVVINLPGEKYLKRSRDTRIVFYALPNGNTIEQTEGENIKDPVVKAFWTQEFSKYSQKYEVEATAAIQNKIGQFISTPLIRNIVGQVKSTIDVRDIMDSKKIFIMNLWNILRRKEVV